jgi:glycosyltransferase involved in cell wall biosynthesis
MAIPDPAGADGLPADGARPTAVIYTHSLLERSMTFIRSHAEALRRYRPVYAGAHRVAGLALPPERAVTVNTDGISGQAAEFMFRRFGMAGRFAARLHEFHPVVIHAHFGPSGPSALTVAEALKIPLVITYHGQDATISDAEARKSWRGREYLRGRGRVVERAAVIIAVSDFIRARLIAKGYPERKIVTHRNGIDLESFRRADQRREPVVLFVGRFVEKKGCEFLIRALSELRRSGCPARAVLVGDGPLRPQLERLAAKLGAEVSFTGFLPLPAVQDWLARSQVVAVPSVMAANGDCEGLPTVILEAQAMETPVVVTRHAGNTEGVAAGLSALVVEERDVQALAASIRFFLEDRAAVAKFGAAGRKFVESRFDIVRQAAGLEQIYDRARGIAG